MHSRVGRLNKAEAHATSGVKWMAASKAEVYKTWILSAGFWGERGNTHIDVAFIRRFRENWLVVGTVWKVLSFSNSIVTWMDKWERQRLNGMDW